MKVSSNLLLRYNIFFLLFAMLTASEHSQNWQTVFRKDYKVPTLSWKDIISNHSVHSQIECSFYCGKEQTCVGFKYKFDANSASVNCQLSKTTGKNNMAINDDQGRAFFIDLTKKMKHYRPTPDKEMSTTPGVPTTAVLPHECSSNYTWLNESSRNQNYRLQENKCDDGLSGWYRFGGGAGIKIASSCVLRSRCGTSESGWMNGAHPTVAEGKVTRKVCYTVVVNCCYKSNNIEVVNCGQYYVYKLSRPPACDSRYCGSNN